MIDALPCLVVAGTDDATESCMEGNGLGQNGNVCELRSLPGRRYSNYTHNSTSSSLERMWNVQWLALWRRYSIPLHADGMEMRED